jgi:hypothetical protein
MNVLFSPDFLPELTNIVLGFCSPQVLFLLAGVNTAWAARCVPFLEKQLTRGLRWEVPSDPEYKFKWIGTYTAGVSEDKFTQIWLLVEQGEIYEEDTLCVDDEYIIDYGRGFEDPPSLEVTASTPVASMEGDYDTIAAMSWTTDHFLHFFNEFVVTQVLPMGSRASWERIPPPPSQRYSAFVSGTYHGTALTSKQYQAELLLIDDYDALCNELKRLIFIAERREGVVFDI